MECHFTRARQADINYSSHSVYNPILSAWKDGASTRIELKSEIPDVDFYYTFDNTNPDLHSLRYTQLLSVPKNATRLKVRGYRNGKLVGDLVEYEISKLKLQ